MADIDANGESELLARLLGGDAAAFSLWLDIHYDFIYRVAYRLLGQKMDAEDLTHDVCLTLATKLKSFRGEGSVRAWLGQVTVNAGRDWLRRNKKRAYIEIDPEMAGAGDTADTVYARQVVAAMGQLPDNLRETLILATEGFTYAEMAKALNCPEGTVAWRISAARDQLTKSLEGKRNAAAG